MDINMKNLMGPDKLKGNNELGEKFFFQRSLELFLSLFSSPDPKGHVSYSHHLDF
jgi:hypothetical protein